LADWRAVAKEFVLVLGGARSGKSSYAQALAGRPGGKVLFVATAQPLDEEMAWRIEEHRRRRPQGWRTVEIAADLGRKLEDELGDSDVVLLDCLTLLVANIVTRVSPGPLESPASDAIPNEEADLKRAEIAEVERLVVGEVADLVACISKYEGTFILVSNEVGLGLVPDNQLGRLYRDLLGRANQLLAQQAHRVYFMASGIPVKIKG
jgi:adenosylcobinamide kinase/adenosylcobinamide-phosphate guanylyltransferase